MKLLLTALLLSLWMGMEGQSVYKIISVDSTKGMTCYFTCMNENKELHQQDIIRGAWITFRGMGKFPNLVGRFVKYYPMGYGKRKVIFVLILKN